MVAKETPVNKLKRKTLMGYELSPRQDALVNHLVPSVCASALYIGLIATDVGVIFSHYKNDDPIWASLTLFISYVPVLGSFIIIISNWELWPEFQSFSKKNQVWFWTKVVEHLFFPIWSMWRFAERIFWSIEALRAKNDKDIADNISIITAPRSIELYIFLQSYLHALPQALLQFYILIRHNADINPYTERVQIFSMVFNLLKLSVTTAYYQRFKSQKLSGRTYPWYKQYKTIELPSPNSEEVQLRRPGVLHSRSVIEDRRATLGLEDQYNIEPLRYSAIHERRRSSDLYLEPLPGSSGLAQRQTLLETDFDEDVQTRIRTVGDGLDEADGPPAYTSGSTTKNRRSRDPSILDGLRRPVYRETGVTEYSEPDYNISRVIPVKALAEDDVAGKLISTLWWFTFLLARVLTISMFAYFYFKETIYILTIHFILVVAILLYDVKSDAVKRSKGLFFVFIGLVYIFCIIEFKIKFKKATFIFYGFFFLVFLENLVMCLIWYIGQIESLENDYWFRYVFYFIIGCSILSFSSMALYIGMYKPEKVIIDTKLKTTH